MTAMDTLEPARLRRIPEWVRQALLSGLITGGAVPLGVLLVALQPSLSMGYPLVLVPLLVTGPMSVRGLQKRFVIPAALVAGLLAGVIAALSLSFGFFVLGNFVWGLTMPAAAPPMPTLPRIGVFPMTFMTWAQQDVLFFEPLVALVTGVLALVVQMIFGQTRLGSLAFKSLGTRLATAFASITLLTFVVGWVSFGALEEMHFRAHRLQLQADWQRHVSEIDNVLSRAVVAQAGGEIPVAPDSVVATLDHLAAAAPHQTFSVPAADLRATAANYADSLSAIRTDYADFAQNPSNRVALANTVTSVAVLRDRLDGDATALLATGDVEHHFRLIVVMSAVAVAGLLSLWLSQQAASSVTAPIERLAAHMRRIARGDFARRLPPRGPEELQQLATAVNRMTEDLDRLYAIERAGRAQAEAMANRERELASAKEFWTNTVVHDLKGPLSLLTGYAEMLQERHLGDINDDQERAIAEMVRASDELTGLVSDINDSFSLEMGGMALRTQAIDATALLTETAHEYAASDKRAPQVLASAGTSVLADERLLRRVVRNLLVNAYKHAGPDANVTISALTRGGQVEFAIADNGTGIPEKDLERVFERFYQSDGARAGSGLGLAFCKLVIDRLGGRIWAERNEPRGARVCFALPIAEPSTHDQPRLAA